MTVIEQRMMNIICSTLPKIAKELERIASALSSLGEEQKTTKENEDELHNESI